MSEKRNRIAINNCKEKLLKRDGNTCAVCGRTLDLSTCTIDHIYPRRFGGNDDFDNLQLLCAECNMLKSASSEIYEYQFESFIKELLQRHPKYTNIRSLFENSNTSVAFEYVGNREKSFMFAEIRVSTSYTSNRIDAIIHKLNICKESYPYGKAIFIFPGELTEEYMEEMQKADIEVWDCNYLYNEFKKQINELKESRYSHLIKKIVDKYEDEDVYGNLIKKLDNCEAGSNDWGKYQQLVREILEVLFCPTLFSPIIQSNDFLKNNRRDFILPNYADTNCIWRYFREMYDAVFIVFDAKNSAKSISKQDVLQMSQYLKRDGTGGFGIIISRKGIDRSSQISLREMWVHEHKMIVVLDDNDVKTMINNRKDGNDPAILIRKKIEDLRLSI